MPNCEPCTCNNDNRYRSAPAQVRVPVCLESGVSHFADWKTRLQLYEQKITWLSFFKKYYIKIPLSNNT